MQVGSIEAARAEVADEVEAMGWRAAAATVMEVVQTLVDEGGESAEIALGADLGEVQMEIVRAAYVVVVCAQMATMEATKAQQVQRQQRHNKIVCARI